MRTYWRQRNDLVQSAGRHILRMQKALTQMKCAVVGNVKLPRQSPANTIFLILNSTFFAAPERPPRPVGFRL